MEGGQNPCSEDNVSSEEFFLKHSLPLFLKKVYVTTVNQQSGYASTPMNWKNGMRFDPFLVEESLYRFKTYENVEAA